MILYTPNNVNCVWTLTPCAYDSRKDGLSKVSCDCATYAPRYTESHLEKHSTYQVPTGPNRKEYIFYRALERKHKCLNFAWGKRKKESNFKTQKIKHYFESKQSPTYSHL